MTRPFFSLTIAVTSLLSAVAVVGTSSAAAAHSLRPADGGVTADFPLDEAGNAVLGEPAAAGDEPRYLVQVSGEQVLDDVLDDLDIDPTTTTEEAVVGFSAPLDAAEVRELRETPGVVAVEPDRVMRASGQQSSPPWNLDRIDQRARSLNGLYRYGPTGAGVDAYVLDTGVFTAHGEFAGRIGPGAGYNFGDGYGVQDCHGHGTHVAGTVGGRTWGVAKGVRIRPVRVLDCAGSGSNSAIVAGIDWVVQDHVAGRPAVANLSLGGSPSSIVDSAVQRMISDGITVVVAAGNFGSPTCNFSPARVRAAITVAASDRSDDDASWSNFGPCNDLFAPGVDIRSAHHRSTTGSTLMDGTSMASPHVAGAAAMVLQQWPRSTPAQVAAYLDTQSTKGALSECCDDPDKLLFVMQPAAAPVTVPSAPRSLVATPGNARVDLRWVAPASNGGAAITDYAVQRWTSANPTWTTVVAVRTTSATVAPLANGVVAQFRVAARTLRGVGAWSAAVSATPRAPVTVPSAPRSLVATPGNARVDLRWVAPASNGGAAITDYAVQRWTSANPTWTTVVAVRTTSATVAPLANGVVAQFRVAARTVRGVGTWSTAVSATPRAPVTVPSAPRWLVATPGSERVDLAWTAPATNGGSPITDYVVQRWSLADPAWRTVPDGVTSATTATVSPLAPGLEVELRVAARNAVGVGPFSELAWATPVGAVPSAPVIDELRSGPGELTVTWRDPDGGATGIWGYAVESSTDGGTTWFHAADLDGSTTTTTIGWLPSHTYVMVRVTAYNEHGWSQPSNAPGVVTD